MRSICTTIAAAALLAAPALASAQNLVQNGGFESLDPLAFGFTESPNATRCTEAAHSGMYGMCLISAPGSQYNDTYIFQKLTTVPGMTYQLDFWAGTRRLFFGGGAAEVYWGGVLVGSTPFAGTTPFALSTFVLTAASTSTVLEFVNHTIGCDGPTCDDVGAILHLDDISVTAAPEPATLALTLGGLAVLGAGVRRRRA